MKKASEAPPVGANKPSPDILAVSALFICCASLYMRQAPMAIFCFGVCLVLRADKLPSFLEKHGAKIFTVISALVVGFSIAVRIFMYAKCRSLWLDEAALAESVVSRNWKELFASPLSGGQSAPALYLAAVKAISSVLGYSEFSLRIFSFLSFIGLLVCEYILLKKVLKTDNIKTAFVLMITAVMPGFVYYSNEFKPYMSDAFFVLLTLLLYAFYAQNKISLVKLTVFYVLISGFCSPSIFFIGGILAAEFLAAVFAKDKKHTVHVVISGLSVAALFGLYYCWWMSPIQKHMDGYWNAAPDKSQFNAFFIVLVILLYLLYTLYRQKKASLIILTVSYVLISVLCPPAIFFAGGISVAEFLSAVLAGDRKRIISFSASILSIAAVFGLYYGLRTSLVQESLKGFYNIPQGNTGGLVNRIKDIFMAFDIDSRLVWALVPFALLGVYSLIRQKNKVAYAVVMSMLFACLASSIGKWPLNGRLWLFLPAVVAVFSSAGVDYISKGDNIYLRKIIFCLFLAVTVYYTKLCANTLLEEPKMMRIVSSGTEVELSPQCEFHNTYVYTEEVNPLIEYVKEHIKDDEALYVFPATVPALKFKNGYKTAKIGRLEGGDNIIYGVSGDEWNENKLGPELDAIVRSRKAYLIFSHYWRGIEPGLSVLTEYGTVEPVLVNYDTPLLYFKANE
jgi:hypothetical protein